jgi:hypothetical protein
MDTAAAFFIPGNILFIKKYEFEDGGDSKDKLAIVLHSDCDKIAFIHCLTTSQIKVPKEKILHGCCQSPDNGLSYYMFEEERIIGDENFKFDKNNFIHFRENVILTECDKFLLFYNNDLYLKGKLTSNEYKRLLKCVCNSQHVKRPIKNELLKLKESVN